MKAISASIIVLAAAILIVGGSFLSHTDSKLFVQGLGCFVGIAGLSFWVSNMNNKETPP